MTAPLPLQEEVTAGVGDGLGDEADIGGIEERLPVESGEVLPDVERIRSRRGR